MKKLIPSGCCQPFLGGRLAKSAAEQLAATFKAIADPARLRLLNFIASQPAAETCVCYLTEPLGLSQPTVSHHLKVLFEAGLLARERRGTWIWYRIVPERLAELRDALVVPAAGAGAADAAPARTTAAASRSAGTARTTRARTLRSQR